jgi:hypothetical protein
MATTPTNSTTVNILNLPQAQLATPTDYLVLQTTNGTQIISFDVFNVVKTDINGNATVIGDLSGNNATFIGGINTITLTASQYFASTGQKGWTDTAPLNVNSNNYYDSFTIANGLIISATPTSVDYRNNPIYTTLNTQFTALSTSVATQLTAMSASLNTQLSAVSSALITQFQAATASYGTQLATLTTYSTGIYDATLTPTMQPAANGSLSGVIVQFVNFFGNGQPGSGLPLTLNQITASDFIISPNATTFAQATAFYQAAPFVVPSSISYYGGGNTGLQVAISAANIVSAPVPINVRLLVSYNAYVR